MRGIFGLVLGAMFLATGFSTEAQQAKIYRIGVLSIGGLDDPPLRGFRDGLREVGYIEGKNLFLDIPVKQTYDELRPIAKTYGEKKFDVIVAIGVTAAIIAKELTQVIPIVFLGATNPVKIGLVKSEARPGANVTGLKTRTDIEVQGKRLEVFKEVVPTLRRVAVLYNARGENPSHAQGLALVQKVAPDLGLTLAEKPIRSASDLERTLSSVSKATTDGLFLICSTLFRKPLNRIVALAIEKRLALMGCSAQEVTEKNVLLSYEPDRYRQGQRVAQYVDRILKGTRPQDLPVESPTYFEWVINLRTAKQIGLTIPPNVLARADKVIR